MPSGFCEGSRLAGLPEFVPEPAKTRRKGNNMTTNQSPKDIEQLIDEADVLVQRINFDVLNEMKEEHWLQIEMHARKLERIKSEVQRKFKKGEAYQLIHSTEGTQEAFQEIAKAMGQLKRYFAGDRPDKFE
jgi:hypothetical protein